MDRIKNNYNHTIYACFTGYVVQAIVNNFVPLLFLTFQNTYQISFEAITFLVTVNFGVQLLVDLLSTVFVDKIGYRTSMIIAHGAVVGGLIGLAVLPELFINPYWGLLASIILYAIGGGLLEVLVSPIVESCPTKNKEGVMSLLHSFYCWGHVLVVLVSTLFFVVIGIGSWKILAVLWAVIPFFNLLYFTQVPIKVLVEEAEGASVKELFKNKIFWVLMILMICSGASEQGMSQWSSAFAESGLRVSKTIGDLAGPCTFAVLMGCSRVFYAKFSEKIRLQKFMIMSAVLCVVCYLLAALSGNPVLSLIGCGLCGFSVGILWPGSFSLATKSCRNGGTAIFALLALGGDLGCAGGPALVGFVSQQMGGNLKYGLLAAIVFPVVLICGISMIEVLIRGKKQESFIQGK